MTNWQIPEYLYMAEEDLFRLGNSTSPRLEHIRDTTDIGTYERNGIKFVVANLKGFSLLTEDNVANRKGVWVWKLPARSPMPNRLIQSNDHPGHCDLCPRVDMPLDSFKSLLSELAVKCERIRKQ